MRLVKYLSTDSGRAIDFIEITMRPDFIRAIETLRKKWKINPEELAIGVSQDENAKLGFMLNKSIIRDVKSLLSSLEIPTNWEDVVHRYLVDGTEYFINDKNKNITKNIDGLALELDLDNPQTIVLKVGRDATLEDVLDGWNRIQQYREMLGISPKRNKDRANFFRDREIFLLAKEEKTASEINSIMKQRFGTEVLDPGNIKKIVSSFYDRLKIPKKDRVVLRTK